MTFLCQGVGAVASRRAAELYGLEIVDEDINDNKDNVTRFIKLARCDTAAGANTQATTAAGTAAQQPA
jgi:prephenate dehydratase